MLALGGTARINGVGGALGDDAPGRFGRDDARIVRRVRIGCVLGAAAWSVLAVGLYARAGWAVALWPWPDVRMSYIFLASIAVGVAAPVLWMGLSGELAAMAGGALNLTVTAGGIAGYLVLRVIRDNERDLLGPAVVVALFALGNLGLLWWSRGFPVRDPRPMPRLVRGAFLVFAVTLIGVGTALVLQTERIFPWDLSPRSSTVFGWIFLGASAYFLYAVARPGWAFAAGTLWGFFAYDLVLFSPYIAMIGKDSDPTTGFDPYGYGVTTAGNGNGVNGTSLVVYLIVLSTSTLLCLWTFFLRRETRIWRGL